MQFVLTVLVLSTASVCLNCPRLVSAQGPSTVHEVVYSWSSLDYNWPNNDLKQEYIQDGRFEREKNVLSGIKVYKDNVYVTVPRWFSGVPATLNRIVPQPSGKSPLLQPFPTWGNHTIGDCNAFQFVQAIEVDPNSGLMFIVDTGRSGIFGNQTVKRNACFAKIVVIDLDNNVESFRYEFPEEVVSQSGNYLNDIVLEYIDNEVSYAYITDTGKPGIVVFNVKNKTSYRFEDEKTMSIEGDKPIFVDGEPFNPKVPINGIAMSSDFRYVYFSAVVGTSLYQVPTSALRDPTTDIATVIRKVGDKSSQSDGMIYAQKNLYFGGLNDSSLYKWEVSKDANSAGSEGNVTLTNVSPILRNVPELTWVDTLAIDAEEYLWFTCSSAGQFFKNKLNFTSTDAKFWMIKIHIGEMSYLSLNSKNEEPTTEPVNTVKPKTGENDINSANGVSVTQLISTAFFFAITHRVI